MKNIKLLCAWAALSAAAPTALTAQQQWKNDIDAFRRADSIAPSAKGGILFVGSSTFALWKDYAAYFPNHVITKRGFGGSAMSDAIYYYEYLVKPHAPQKMFVYEGDNELAGSTSVDEYMENARCFVRLTQICFPQCAIYFVAIKPSPARKYCAAKHAEANRRLRLLAEQSGGRVHFIDLWGAMANADGTLNAGSDYFLPDQLHLNDNGYRLLAQMILPCLKK